MACVAAALLAGSVTPSPGWADIIIDGRQVMNPYTLSDHQELDAGYEIVGATDAGVFNHLSGENELRGTLTIADTPTTAISTYTFNNGELSSANTIVGNAGTGTFTQNGGSHEIRASGKISGSGTLTIGNMPGGDGTYNLNAGELTVDALSIGVAGTGTFTQNGGEIQIGKGDLNFGSQAGGSGTYTLNAGSLRTGNAHIGVAAGGTGTFNHYGGTVSVSDTLTLGGPLEGAGSYNLGNPSSSSGPAPVLTAGSETIGDNGSGQFTHSAGLNRVAGTLLIGGSTGSGSAGNGTYDLEGGTLNANAEIVGNAGVGTFIQNGGTNQVGGGNLIVGNLNGGFGGFYIMNDGTLTADFVTVALAARGRFFQRGGTVLLEDGLTVGAVSTNGRNLYFLVGGSLQAGGNETIGDAGTGFFQQAGGTNTISGGGLVLGNQTSGIGRYIIVDGSILTADFATIGQAGTGAFSQFGGTVTLSVGHGEPNEQGPNGDFHFDGHDAALVLGNAPTGTGSYDLEDGTLTVAGKGVEIIGNAGTGNFTQEGGTHQVTGLLVLGGAAGGNGTYTLSGGTLTLSGLPTDPDATSTLVVGADGTGTFNLSGGTANVAGSVVVGGESGSAGFLNISAGTLTSGAGIVGDEKGANGTVAVTAPGSWTVSAGNLVVGEEGQGLMTISRGGLVTTSGSNWAIIGDQKGSVGVVTVTDPGSQLMVGGFLVVGDKGLGTLNVLNGGVVTALGTLPPSAHNHDDVPLAPITIGRSGTVAGNGTLNGNVLNFGVMRPQSSPSGPGTLSVNGSYTQAPTGTLAIEVTSASGVSSSLAVTGPALLRGTLALAFDPGTYAQGESYILLTGNTVSGTFGRVTQTGNIGLLRPNVTYTPLEVDMTLMMAPLQSFAATPNQFGVASALQQAAGTATGGGLLTVVNALVQNSPSQAQTAFTAMAGTAYPSLPAVAADTLHAAAAGVFGHWDGSGMALAGTRFLPGNAVGGNGLLSASPAGRGTTAFQLLGGPSGDGAGMLGTPGMGFWAQALNGYAISGSGDPLASSASAQTSGLLLGRDIRLSPNLQIGTTFGSWQSGATMSDASGQSAGLTTGLVAAYGRYTSGDWTVDALAGYTFDTVSVSRPIGFIGRTATATYAANDMIGSLQVARPMQWGGVTVAPGVGLDYVQSTLPTVTESGADSLDLTIAGGTVTSLRGVAGIRFTSPADTGNFGWTAYAGYAHEFGATAFTTTATLAGAPNAPFGVTTATAADSWSAGVGLNWHLWDGADFHVSYDALLSTVQINQTGSIGLDLHF